MIRLGRLFIVVLLISSTIADDTSKQCTKDNERYVECDAICNARTCSEAGFLVPCQLVEECSGNPGCICKEGYLRNDDGVCIPRKQCPSCGGDINAVPGCGNHCGRVCGNYASRRWKRCALFCLDNGCDCKLNYVFNEITGKCVLPDDC